MHRTLLKVSAGSAVTVHVGQALEGGVELQGSVAVERGLTLKAVVLTNL